MSRWKADRTNPKQITLPNIKMANLFDIIDLNHSEEQFEYIIHNENFAVERIVSFGHPSPDGYWYDQPNTEWVALLKGESTIEYQDETTKDMTAGDHMIIPKGLRHRVKSVSEDAVWIAIHYK